MNTGERNGGAVACDGRRPPRDVVWRTTVAGTDPAESEVMVGCLEIKLDGRSRRPRSKKTGDDVERRVFGWFLFPRVAFLIAVGLVPNIQSDWSGDVCHRGIPWRFLVRLDVRRDFLARCPRLRRQSCFQLLDAARLFL